MASVVTYVLVSNPADPDAVAEHDVIENHEFDLQQREVDEEGSVTSLRFATTTALQENPALERPVRELSQAFPEAVVTFCEVEERFNNVEHLRTVVYLDGQSTGHIEHGYTFNVGAR